MTKPLTRQQMYAAVWSKPMQILAKDFGVSDVALAKACRRTNIPVPPRGYWAKKDSGKPVSRPPLPPRFPGADDTVEVGNHRWSPYWQPNLLDTELPPPPEFPEDLTSVRDRVAKMVSKVPYPMLAHQTHPLIRRLLEKDEKRCAEHEEWPIQWNEPWYKTPADKRRLRLLNALFLAMQRLGCKPDIDTRDSAKDDRSASFIVGDTGVSITLATPELPKGAKATKAGDNRLSLAIHDHPQDPEDRRRWDDSDAGKIEKYLTEIVRALLVTAETHAREEALHKHQWLVELQAQQEEAARQRKLEAERAARELQQRLERERIERLLAQAEALRSADTIRHYVASMQDASSSIAASSELFDRWATWALEQADRIDPRKTGAFLADLQGLANDHQSIHR